MFSAGLETNLQELKKSGLKAFVIACVGVLFPFVCGALLYMCIYGFSSFGSEGFFKALFIGSIMTATSVGITVEVLKEMGVRRVVCKAADEIRPLYPERRLYIMDTYCISGGLGTLVENMVERMEAGASFDEVVAWGEENKLKIAHRFTVDDLNYLKAGGRVSNSAALVGSLLSIKPVLYVPDRGTLDVVKKARGRKAALKAIIDGVLHDMSKIDPTGVRFHILHADCLSDAEHARDAIRAAYPQVGEITITSLGVVIGAHCGPGLLTVFYLCDSRQPE